MKIGRFLRTVRYLRIGQVISKVRFMFRRVNVGSVAKVHEALPKGSWVTPPRKTVGVNGPNDFRILNTNIRVASQDDWNTPSVPKLVLYHLHYHDVINSKFSSRCGFNSTAFVERWVAENPPVIGNGWEPYPLALRIVNWVKWHHDGSQLSEGAAVNLYLQARALSQQIEYHLMANHLFANAKGLFFASIFFRGDEATQWKDTSLAILQAQLNEQFLNDGGHFELSPMYQATMIEDVLDLINLSRLYKDDSLGDLTDLVSAAINWLALMSHGDDRPAFFNDSTFDVAPILAELSSYAERLGILTDVRVENGIHHLKRSGYVRYQASSVALVADIGRIGPDYQPGHGHCDCLSFELSIADRRQLVNSGVSTYETCEQRVLERRTAAHNTVSIEGQEQSEIWSAFRVGRRARPIDVDVGDSYISACHDGYLRAGIIHRRRIEFLPTAIEIVDKLEASTSNDGVAHFHFSPATNPVIGLRSVKTDMIEMTFDDDAEIEVGNYSFSNGFHNRIEAQVLRVSFRNNLRTRISFEDTIHIR